MDINQTEKFKFLSCLAMIAVVVGHSAPATVIGTMIGKMCLFAVPMFFAVSGFWFIKSLEKYGALLLLQRKVRTLALPYLIWCFVGWLAFRPGLGDTPMLILLGKIFGFAKTFPIGNLPLWYVRALISFIIIGCALWVGLRPFLAKSGFLFCCLFMGSVFLIKYCLGYGVASDSSSSFFCIGCYLSLAQIDLNAGKKVIRRVAGSVLLILYVALVEAVDPTGFIGFGIQCCALVSLWLLSDDVVLPQFMGVIAPYSAIIYFMHGIIVFKLDSLILPCFPVAECHLNCYFIIKFLLLISMLGVIAFGLKKKMPRLYAVLSGYR